MVIAFLITPILVKNLGDYDYGLWEILVAILGYMGLLDFGMKPTIVRFVAKYHAENSHQRLQNLYSTAWVFMFFVGLTLCCIFIAWSLIWPESITNSDGDVSRYSILLAVIGFQLLVTFPGYVAEGFLEGYQKFHVKNNIAIAYLIIANTIIFFLMTPANGILLLAGVSASGNFFKYTHFALLISREKYGGLQPRFKQSSWKTFHETARFGFKSLVQGVAYTIEAGTDTLVIGYLLGAATVPFYSIPANLVLYVRGFGWTITQAFMPLFSALYAQEKSSEIQTIYINASKYVIALLLPISIGAILLGSSFIGIWVGKQYQEGADLIILLLTLYIGLPYLNPFSIRYLTAISAHGRLAKITTVGALVNISLSIILVNYYGIVGAALGSLIPVIFIIPIVLKMCCWHLKIKVRAYIFRSIYPVLMPALIMIESILVFKANYLVDSYLNILLAGGLGSVCYAIAFYIFGLSQKEKKWLWSKF